MNKFIGIGNLCKDVEIRYTSNNKPVVQNTLAIRNNFKNKEGNYDSEFINVVFWNNQAEFLGKYATKGSKLSIEGRLTNRSYEKQDKTTAYITEVIVENVGLLSSKNTQDVTEELPKNIKSNYQENEEITLSDEDLPF